MQTKAYIIIVLVIIIVGVALVALGIFDINLKSNDPNGGFFDIKTDSLRSVMMTLYTLAIGYVTIIFELKPHDKYGNTFKQENHFQLFYLMKKIKSPYQSRNRIPSWIWIPYPIYIIAAIISCVLCILSDNKTAGYLMYFLLIVSTSAICIYVSYVIRVMYSQDWIVSYVGKICSKAKRKIDIKYYNKNDDEKILEIFDTLKIATEAIRVLSLNSNSVPKEIVKIISENSSIQLYKDIETINYFSDYYKELLISYAILCAKNNDRSNCIEYLLNKIFTDVDGTSLAPSGVPFFAIAGIAGYIEIRDLNIKFQKNDYSGFPELNLHSNILSGYSNSLLEWLNINYDNQSEGYSDSWIFEAIEIIDDESDNKDAMWDNLNSKLHGTYGGKYDMVISVLRSIF